MAHKIVFPYKNLFFDSQEERWFAMWCDELQKAGYIASWGKGKNWQLTKGLKLDYVKTTQLKTKVKTEEKSKELLKPSEYTSDFLIFWTPLGRSKFVLNIRGLNTSEKPQAQFYDVGDYTHVEIKPMFDQNNMTRLFVNNQKFIWDKFREFVNLIYPEDLFKQTFMPGDAVKDFKFKKSPTTGKNKGKKPGDWKVDYIPKTLKEFLNGE